MDKNLQENLTAKDTWVRGLFMLLFIVVYGVAEAVWFLVALFQFIHALVTHRPRASLLEFSDDLCTYIYEILLYISFSSEQRPFPFAPWPSERVREALVHISEPDAETDIAEEPDDEVTSPEKDPTSAESVDETDTKEKGSEPQA